MSGLVIHNFSHTFLGTPFWIRVADEDYAYAQQATSAIFYHIHTLLPQIDVHEVDGPMTGINQMPLGGLVPVGDHFKALWGFAERLKVMSNGAFDVSAGKVFSFLEKTNGKIPTDSADFGEFFESAAKAEWNLSGNEFCRIQGDAVIDFSALIKGYLCDVAADLLENRWGIHRALILAGGNRVLALDAPEGASGWRLGIGESQQIFLSRSAMVTKFGAQSSSQLINLLTREIVQSLQPLRVLAKEAMQAEGLSCAWALMTPSQVEANLLTNPDWGIWWADDTRRGSAQKLKPTPLPASS